MIYGEYRHTLDTKGRTFVPSKLREELGDDIVLANIADKCIAVYPIEKWNAFKEKIEALPPIKAKEIKRRIFPYVTPTTIDIQGRIAIPTCLRERAELSKNLVSIGVGDYAEIWDEELYDAMQSSINDEEITATLIELGM